MEPMRPIHLFELPLSGVSIPTAHSQSSKTHNAANREITKLEIRKSLRCPIFFLSLAHIPARDTKASRLVSRSAHSHVPDDTPNKADTARAKIEVGAEELRVLSSPRIQDSPSNLTNGPISTTTAIAITTQMSREISFGIKDTFAGTTTTKTSLRTFLHSYRYPKN
jgi:hypothetical protein